MLPETALLGGFSLVIDHFISEMADWGATAKKLEPPLSSPAVPVAILLPAARALLEIDFRVG